MQKEQGEKSGLRWDKLKQNKCPRCCRDMASGLTVRDDGMLRHKCGFMIRQERMKEIVAGMVERDMAHQTGKLPGLLEGYGE